MLASALVFALLHAEYEARQSVFSKEWSDGAILNAISKVKMDSAEIDRLVAQGDLAFPAFERWLKNPAQDGRDSTGAIIAVLRYYKCDRSRFIKYAVQLLTHRLSDNRCMALELLAQIGSVREASAVVAMLSDEEVTVAHEAADCLIAIGSERELIAFDICLRAERAKGRKDLEWLPVKRDKLKERLDKQDPGKKITARPPSK